MMVARKVWWVVDEIAFPEMEGRELAKTHCDQATGRQNSPSSRSPSLSHGSRRTVWS